MEMEASQTRSSLQGVPTMWAETIVPGGVRMPTVWTPEWPCTDGELSKAESESTS